MSEPDNGRPGEELFNLHVEVPEDIRGDPARVREWLEAMSRHLLNAEHIQLTHAPVATDVASADADRVSVTMLVRPCGGRFSVGEEAPGEDGDAGTGEPGSDVGGDGGGARE